MCSFIFTTVIRTEYTLPTTRLFDIYELDALLTVHIVDRSVQCRQFYAQLSFCQTIQSPLSDVILSFAHLWIVVIFLNAVRIERNVFKDMLPIIRSSTPWQSPFRPIVH